MANLKISALPSATLPLAGTETIPLVQGGVTSKALASDLFQWPGGRVSYVPVGGNIQAYVTAATAGDTLILGAGTYTVTATIRVDKAILIKGQGLSATKVVTSTADLAVFTLTASTARVSDLYVGNTGTGTSFAFYVGDGLTQLQISNVVAVLGGNGLKYGVWSQSSITISNCEMYITSANLNSNGVMIYNETGATANINANIQNVRVLSTGATLNNRGIVFNNNDVANTIAGNVTNCNLNAYASTGVTDIALYVNSTTTNNVTVNAYNSLFNGADSDVTVIGTNSCTLSNCTLTHGTATGTVVYAGTQVTSKVVAALTGTVGATTPAVGSFTTLSASGRITGSLGCKLGSWQVGGTHGLDSTTDQDVIEASYEAGVAGHINAINRGGGGSVWKPMTLSGITVALQASGTTVALVSSTDLAVTGAITATTTIKTGGYTVATLPAAGTAGRMAYVTDALLPLYNSALTGAGAVVVPVFDNGVAWTSH